MRVWQKKTRVIGFVLAITFSVLLTHSSLRTRPQTALAQGAGIRLFLPIIMKPPAVAKSYYMVISQPDFNPYTLGQAEAEAHQPIIQGGKRLMFVLAWGQPCNIGGVIGAYSYDREGICHSTGEFQAHMKNYLDGYCTKMQSIRPGGVGQNCGYRYNTQAVPIIIGFGPNNCVGGSGCSNAPDDPSNAVTYANGQAWGTLVQNISNYAFNQGYTYQIFIAGAMDIEGAWNTYTNTKAWLNGYKSTSSRNFYNFGNCDCPDGYQPFAPFPRDWNYNKIHEVSYRGGSLLFSPLPEIYHTDGIDARRWQGLSEWAALNGHGKMTFRELLTTSGTCAQGSSCPGINNGPMDAIIQMRQALDADLLTAGGLILDVRSTDLSWYPRP